MKLFFALALAVVLGGCQPEQTAAEGSDNSSSTTTTSTQTATDEATPTTAGETTGTEAAAPPTTEGEATGGDDPQTRKPKNGEEVAVLDTNHGKIVLMFFNDKAPGHVKNFKDLARKGFYNGTKFHRVIPGFMIQGGDPNSKNSDRSDDGMGDPGYKIKAEFNDIKHDRGILSMARSSDPDSAGSQFYIVVAHAPHLDGQYTAFGRTLSGFEVVDKIVALPRDENDNPLPANPAVVKSVKIVKWPVK